MKFLIVSALIFSSAFAGNEVGNGGDVIICKIKEENKAKNVKSEPALLDFYEYKTEVGFKLDEFDIQNEYQDEYRVAQTIVERLKKVSKKLHAQYSKGLEKFRGKVRYLSGEELSNIEDSFHISIKKGCEIRQIAIQRIDPLNKDTVIYINKDLYDKLTPLHKAGLILHELIYEHFLFFEVTNSVKVRFFNRYLFSKEIKDHGPEDLRKISEGLEIPLY
jgi:hypothetical protein